MQRIELADLPRDPLNQLSSVRSNLVKVRNSARLSDSKAALLKKTLEYVLQSLSDAPEGAVPVPATKPLPLAEGPAPVVHKKRRATAKVDKAAV